MYKLRELYFTFSIPGSSILCVDGFFEQTGSHSFYAGWCFCFYFLFFIYLPFFMVRLKLWVSSKSLVAQFDWFGVAASMVANCGFLGRVFPFFLSFFSLPFLAFLIFCP